MIVSTASHVKLVKLLFTLKDAAQMFSLKDSLSPGDVSLTLFNILLFKPYIHLIIIVFTSLSHKSSSLRAGTKYFLNKLMSRLFSAFPIMI